MEEVRRKYSAEMGTGTKVKCLQVLLVFICPLLSLPGCSSRSVHSGEEAALVPVDWIMDLLAMDQHKQVKSLLVCLI